MKPSHGALFRLEVNIVPSINGKSIRVNPNGFDTASTIVSTTVAANPHNTMLYRFISYS
jgi:hypothetical protein